jgi:hypothetical protein
MAVPEKVQVRVMSDAAGFIEMTHVAHREVPFAEMLDLVVAVAGLDPARIVTLLKSGTAAVNAYRYRWPPLVLDAAELSPLLERFPRPQPERPFDAGRCLLAKIRAGVETIELPRESAARFWDVLMEVAQQRSPAYETYSYRDGADLYSFAPSSAEEQTLRRAAHLLQVARTAEQVTGLPLEKVVLYVKR